MSLVPLPWWTSQSTIITRSTAVRRRRAPRRDRDVVEEAEPHRARRLGVVAGRAQRAHAGRRLAAQQRVDQRDRTAGGVQRRLERRRPRRRCRRRSCPPPRGAQLLDERDVLLRVHGVQLLARGRRRLHALAAEPAVRAPSRLRARRIRSGRSGCPGTSWRSDASWRSQMGRRPRRYRTPPVVPCRRARSDLVVVGAGAAGLFAALTAAREGARVTLVSARPLAETASYWAQGGAAAALARRRLARSCTSRTRSPPAAASSAARAAEVLTDEAPARFRDLVELGVRFDADRHGDLALGLEGGHSVRRIVHAGGSATGRRILRELSAARGRARRAIEVLEGRRVAALLDRRRPRRRRAARRRPRSLAARASILATGGAAALWSRTTNPPGSFGSGLLLARAAGADARRPRVHPVPPDRGHRHPRPRGLPDLRGRPRRGRDAARRRTASASSTSSSRATRSRARSSACCSDGRAVRQLDMATVDPGALPEHRRGAARGRPGPDDAARPGRPRQPLRDGRDRHRPRRPLHASPASTPSASAPARACTAPTGSRRTRSASASSSAAAPRSPALDEPPPARPRARRRPIAARRAARETRAAVWALAGLERDAPRTSRALLDDPHPLARLVAACALAREETRGAHARAEFPATDPTLDDHHTILDAATSMTPRFDRMDVSRSTLLNAKSTHRRSEFHERAANARAGPRGDSPRRGSHPRETSDVPLQPFHLSGTPPDIVEDRHARRTSEPRARPALLRAGRRAPGHRPALLRQADEDPVQRHPDLLPDVRAARASTRWSIAT